MYKVDEKYGYFVVPTKETRSICLGLGLPIDSDHACIIDRIRYFNSVPLDKGLSYSNQKCVPKKMCRGSILSPLVEISDPTRDLTCCIRNGKRWGPMSYCVFKKRGRISQEQHHLCHWENDMLNGRCETSLVTRGLTVWLAYRCHFVGGKKHGYETRFTFHRGEIKGERKKSKIYFEYGIKQGHAQYFYSNGRLRKTLLYKDGKKQGQENGYWLAGGKKYTCQWENDKQHGHEYVFSRYNDRIVIGKSLWIKGKREGYRIFFDNINGTKVVGYDYWFSGKKEGLSVEFVLDEFDAGMILKLGNNNYVTCGPMKRYCYYSNDKKEGTETIPIPKMNQHGFMVQEILNYLFGKYHGVCKYRYADGMEEIINYFHGEKHGEMESVRSQNGKHISYWRYDKRHGPTFHLVNDQFESYSFFIRGKLCGWELTGEHRFQPSISFSCDGKFHGPRFQFQGRPNEFDYFEYWFDGEISSPEEYRKIESNVYQAIKTLQYIYPSDVINIIVNYYLLTFPKIINLCQKLFNNRTIYDLPRIYLSKLIPIIHKYFLIPFKINCPN